MRVTAVVSEQGLGAADNDDCAGFVETPGGLCAWVIDGATNVAGSDYLAAGLGDVAWYSRALSGRLEAHAPGALSLSDLHAAAAAEVAEDYRELCRLQRAPPPLHAQPMAALTMLRIGASGGELYHLGDCPAFALSDDPSVRRITVWEPNERSDESRARVMATQAKVGFAPKAVWADRLSSLQLARERQLSANPLQVSTPVAGAAFGGYAASFDLAGVAAIVLMSDGFERFATHYALGDEAAMVRRAVTEGPAPVLAALRAVEQADPDCRRFPRLKRSDDATCLVLSHGR